MYHIDNPNGHGVSSMPEPKPQQTTPSTPQWFTEGTGAGDATIPGADWFNIVQAEILNVLAAAGISPDKATHSQLAAAIQVIAQAKVSGDPILSKLQVLHENLYHNSQSLKTKTGIRIGLVGTSLVNQNTLATTQRMSTSSRGWWTWADFYLGGRFLTPVWWDSTVLVGWEPSQVPGATRYFYGANAGVSGQTCANIYSRKEYLVDTIDVDWVVVDMGTNDMAGLAKEVIHQYRVDLCNYYLSHGKKVILLPILARSTTSWTTASGYRAKANWINRKSREFVDNTQNTYLFDWNDAWVNFNDTYGQPITTVDGTHFDTQSAERVGYAFAQFLDKLLPITSKRVTSPDDLYDAVNNPSGNLLTNPMCLGTTGTLGAAGITGVCATGMKLERTSQNLGAGTVVGSKEARTDGRGEYQVITITPDTVNTNDNIYYFRTGSSTTTHTLAAGDWVQSSIEIETNDWAGIRSITLYMKDSVSDIQCTAMEQYDTQPFLAKARKGTLITPAIQLAPGSTGIVWRVMITTVGTVTTGTGVVKIGAVELRKVQDPRDIVKVK